VGTAPDTIHRASAVRLLARFSTASGATTTLVQSLRDDEPLVRASAAWALGQRPSLTSETRAALLERTTDPVRIVRQHVAFALRSGSPADLPPDAATSLARAFEEWRGGHARLADTPEAQYNLALFDGARGDVDGAVRGYRAALRLWPGSFQARHNLGML